MEKQEPPNSTSPLPRTHESTSKSPNNFTIPKYADKFKDIIAKSQLQRKFVPPQIDKPPPKAQQQFFFFRVKRIGLGAHSFVYLVQEEQSKMLLSQKSITKQHAKEIEQDLFREIKFLTCIEHNNIIKLYHFYCNETHLNLVMEFAQDSLFALKNKFGTFKEKQIVQVIKQLLFALQYLHQRNIVHADIKLQNVMIANGTIKLVDFGLAHRVKEKEMKEVDGTMQYLPPEYAQGNDSGTHRDIWAVGILAFEMSVGKHPLDGLKESQKWAKLVKSPPQIYTQLLQQQQKAMGMQSQKVIELVKGIFQPCQKRWSADKLLQLPFFNPQ